MAILIEMRYALLVSGTHYTLKQSCIYYDTYNDTSLSSTVDQFDCSLTGTSLRIFSYQRHKIDSSKIVEV